MRFSILSLAAAATLAGACATNPAPVRLSADPEGKSLIAGEWLGDYFTSDGGRVGNISFSFVDHDTTKCGMTGEHGHGDVLMIGGHGVMPEGSADEGRDPLEPAARALSIDIVRVTGHQIWGRLNSYVDPETGETLSTTFEGTIEDSVIRGTLQTIHARTGAVDAGKWEVFRKKS